MSQSRKVRYAIKHSQDCPNTSPWWHGQTISSSDFLLSAVEAALTLVQPDQSVVIMDNLRDKVVDQGEGILAGWRDRLSK